MTSSEREKALAVLEIAKAKEAERLAAGQRYISIDSKTAALGRSSSITKIKESPSAVSNILKIATQLCPTWQVNRRGRHSCDLTVNVRRIVCQKVHKLKIPYSKMGEIVGLSTSAVGRYGSQKITDLSLLEVFNLKLSEL